MKNILITGEGSYIGTNVENWLKNYNKQAEEKSLPEPYNVVTINVFSDENNHGEWEKFDFSKFETVYHVAGLAHADVSNVSDDVKKKYYRINTDLALAIAKKAKADGVKQFIFMSSMIIYGGQNYVTAETEPKPANFYGDSKWQADQKLRQMESENFKVAVIRPPMIYGKGSKGNYPVLAKMAAKLPFFPVVNNKRSMLHIDNLCEFIRLVIDNDDRGIFFPQNAEYSNTSKMVKMIADIKGHKILMLHGVAWLVHIMMHIPGKIGKLASKAFGSSCYELSMSDYKINYRINDLQKSIELTEK